MEELEWFGLEDVEKDAEDIARTLEPGDARFRGAVLVQHSDGSTHFFRHAFLKRRGPFVTVFAERGGSVIFFEPELTSCTTYGAGAIVKHIEVQDA